MTQYDVRLRYNSLLDEALFEDFLADVEKLPIRLRVDKYLPEIQASVAWLMPTAVALYFMKPYFEGFLREAGKDHYNGLKQAFKKLSAKLCTGRIVPTDKNGASLLFSVYAETSDGRRTKFIFKDGRTQDEYEACFDGIISILKDHYKSDLGTDRLTQQAALLENPAHKTVYLAFDEVLAEWNVLDHMVECRKIAAQQKAERDSKL